MSHYLNRSRARVSAGVFLALALVLSACSADEPSPATDAMADMDAPADGDDHGDEMAFGEPADAATADRVIEIDASDSFTFDPGVVSVTVGETITFRVTNSGVIPHDFTLGDQATQDDHEAEMAAMGDQTAMHDEPNAFVLEAGETKEMTWHFTTAGEIQMGCHQAGHYAAGMKGSISVGA